MKGRPALMVFAAIGVAACSLVPPEHTSTLKGTAQYRERIALPAGAMLEVTLEDVSRADTKAEIIRQMRIPARSSPIPFTLDYNPVQIRPGESYAVRARILDGKKPIFTTDTFQPAFVDGKPVPLELLLRMTSIP